MALHIKHMLAIDCPSAIVYKALTTREGIQGWWTTDTVIEPELNTIAEFTFGDRYHNKMVITDLQPNKRVAWFCKHGDTEWIGTDFSFDLEEKGSQTLLRFGHNNWRDATDFFDYCKLQWEQYMVSLKQFCETGDGSPFSLQDEDNRKL